MALPNLFFFKRLCKSRTTAGFLWQVVLSCIDTDNLYFFVFLCYKWIITPLGAKMNSIYQISSKALHPLFSPHWVSSSSSPLDGDVLQWNKGNVNHSDSLTHTHVTFMTSVSDSNIWCCAGGEPSITTKESDGHILIRLSLLFVCYSSPVSLVSSLKLHLNFFF